MKKIFLDTEFTGLHQTTSLISLALVADSGEKFYAICNDYESEQIDDFVNDNVLPYLQLPYTDDYVTQINGNRSEIASALRVWIGQFSEKIQIWADVSHYDWVLFCELFGGSLNLPTNIHYICMDLATLLFVKKIDMDISRVNLLEKEEIPKNYIIHNALSDAEVGMIMLNKLLYGKENV